MLYKYQFLKKLAILKKAALFEKDDFKKYKETVGKKRGKSVIKKR